MTEPDRKNPKAFISYAWENDEHTKWVTSLATRLRNDGVDVTLDRWELVPGDSLTAFMERAVRENDFVLSICTPEYARKFNDRLGGVGYEGNVSSGELFVRQNHRKFIPVLCRGTPETALPSLYQYKVSVNLTEGSEEEYERLVDTLYERSPRPAPAADGALINLRPPEEPRPGSTSTGKGGIAPWAKGAGIVALVLLLAFGALRTFGMLGSGEPSVVLLPSPSILGTLADSGRMVVRRGSRVIGPLGRATILGAERPIPEPIPAEWARSLSPQTAEGVRQRVIAHWSDPELRSLDPPLRAGEVLAIQVFTAAGERVASVEHRVRRAGMQPVFIEYD